MYKETTWTNAIENEKVTVAIESNEASKQVNSRCCPIHIKSGESIVKGEISGRFQEDFSALLFLLKEEGGEINGNMFCTTYRLSPIQSGGMEIHLICGFKVQSM